MPNFQKRLKYFRERKGLTQIELAKIVGLSHNQLSRYEKGHNTPNVVVLEWLCQALGVSSKDLLGF